MTLSAVAMWHESSSLLWHARDYRRLLHELVGLDPTTTQGTGAGGIMRPGAMAVTEKGTPNMSVDVAAGGAIVNGTEAANQGAYFVYNDAVVNLTFTSDGSNPRIVIIGAKVEDSEYSGAVHAASLVAVSGTPAGSPAEPTLPENFLTLAKIDVPALDTAVTNSQITDRRRMLGMLGGTIICTSTTRPTTPFEGMKIYETDTNRSYTYYGSAWQFEGRAYDRKTRTAGDLVPAFGNWANADTGMDIVLPAAAGDVIEVGLSGAWSNSGAGNGLLDAVTVVSGNPVNSFGKNAAVDNNHYGVLAWMGPTSTAAAIGSNISYVLQAGDISSGNVTLRLRMRVDQIVSKALNATANLPLTWFAKNMGPDT